MPPDPVGEPVHVLEELPRQPCLADAGGPEHADQPGPALAHRGMQQILEQAQLVGATNERRFEHVRPATTPDLGHHAHGSPRGDGRGPALDRVLASRFERDRARRRPLRALADQDRPGGGRRLQPAGGVDEVPGDHPLVRRPERDRGLARQDAGAGGHPGPQRGHGVDELQSRPDRALSVVLVRDRRAPDGHDRVADELLDRAPVPPDHVAGEVEVARQQLAGRLCVQTLGQRREPDQVREQDRDQPALGDGCGRSGLHRPALGRGHRPGAEQPGRALATELRIRGIGSPARGA